MDPALIRQLRDFVEDFLDGSSFHETVKDLVYLTGLDEATATAHVATLYDIRKALALPHMELWMP